MTVAPQTKDDALVLLDAFRTSEKPDLKAIYPLSACALEFGLFDETVAVYETLLGSPASDAETVFETLFAYAHVKTGMREFPAAHALIVRACDMQPQSANAWINLSRLNRLMGAHDAAITAAEKAFQLERANGHCFAELTRSYSFGGRSADLQANYSPKDAPEKGVGVRGSALFDLGAYDQAEAALAGHVSFLTPDFMRRNTIPTAQLATSYPPLDGEWPIEKSKPVVFMACDQVYFDTYARAFAQSVSRLGPSRSLHLHVYDPTRSLEALRAEVAPSIGSSDLSLTAERIPKPDKIYYSAARFLRFSQLLDQHEAPVASLDADSLVVRDVFEESAADIIGFERPEFANVKQRFYAAYLRAQPTAGARRFLEMLTSFIALAFHLERGLWFVDQMGLLVAHKVLVEQDQSVIWQDLGHAQIQYQYLQDSALVWAGKGLQKEFPDLPAL